MTRAELLARAKVRYAAGAQRAGGLLERVGVLPDVPPPRRHRLRHWAVSLARVHDSLALAELDVPWWTYRAIDVVDSWLAARPRPARVFEYGAGASTVWLARRAGAVHSVEHDPAFAGLLMPLLAAAGTVELRTVPAVAAARPTIASAKEGYGGLDFADYVGAIDDVGGDFDLVVVDGRARAACLARSLPRLRPDGLIVFDNSRRRRYRAAIESAPVSERRWRGLTPTLPYPEQTSVLRPARP